MKAKSSSDFKEMAIFSFYNAILLTSVNTSPLMSNTLIAKEELEIIGEEFLAIIGAEGLNLGSKLCFNIKNKLTKKRLGL